jgi:hypothetical protein
MTRGYLTTDARGRLLYREWADDVRRALRGVLIAGASVLVFGSLGVMVAIAMTGGL